MTPEQKFWQQVKEHLPGHVTRIENAAGNGMPDVNVGFNGRDYWIELKIAKSRDTVLIRKEQRVWMMYHLKFGCKVAVLAKHREVYYVYDRPDITEFYDERFQKIVSEPMKFVTIQQAVNWIINP